MPRSKGDAKTSMGDKMTSQGAKKTSRAKARTSAAEAAKKKKTPVQIELEKLTELFSPLPENEKAFLQPLLENAAFMRVTLDGLQDEIRASGVTDTYQNGANQHGVKIGATIQAYNQLMKTYHALMDKLLTRLPRGGEYVDELEAFKG